MRKRIAEDYGIKDSEIDSTRRYYNKKRAGYYRANTGDDWKKMENYDVILDSGMLGIDGCVSALKGLLE